MVGIPIQPTFRPQRFARSRRFAPSRTLRACFISQPRPRFPLQGLWPDNQPTSFLAKPCPLAVSDLPLHCPRALRQVRSFQPQGFDPAADPLLPTSGLGLPTPDPLLSFHSCGFFSEHRGDTVAPPPLMTFPVDPSSDLDSGLQRITSVRPALLSPEDSPVRALWPSFCDA